jgi:cytochrome c biogenesis protein CcmG/thiol:disulfide interchange protein DsbE
VAVALLVAVLAVSPKAANVQAASPLVGRPAPALAGPSIDGKGPVALAGLRGRFVVVNFFASWCTPCQQEEPALEAFARTHRGDATVVGVVFEDQVASGRHFLAHYGATYPAIADPGAQTALRYGVANPPTTYVISPRGTVLTKVVGEVTARGLNHVLALARAKHASETG